MAGAPRQALLDAARRVLAAEPGARVAALCAAGGISRATFYRLFPSRGALLAALAIEGDPGTRERVLAAALDLVSRDGLARLSMEALAAAAGVSRATLYRAFPGKAALFSALVRRYAPFDAVAAVVAAGRARPPEALLPEVAAAVASVVRARAGVVRTLFVEMTSGAPESAEAVGHLLRSAVAGLAGYLEEQMARGRLRRMHPLLALQGFVGPILMHVLTRPMVEAGLGLSMPLEEAVGQLAAAWVQGMRAGRG